MICAVAITTHPAAAFQAAVVERRPLMPPVVFKQRFDYVGVFPLE